MSEVDTKLLYVCATRAMNTLDIYHVEPLSKLYNVSTDYLLGLSVTKDDITTLSEQKYGSRSLKELLNDIASLDSENIVLLNAYIDFLISRQKK